MSASTTSFAAASVDAPRTATPRTATPVKALLATSALAILGGAAAAEAVSLAARALDVTLASAGFGSGEAAEIPVGGFATATIMWSVFGVLLAFGLRRWAKNPAQTFTRVCIALTALSIVPVVAINETTTGARITLALTHVAAAVVIVPLIARRLDGRNAR
jgi:hypothetical protein